MEWIACNFLVHTCYRQDFRCQHIQKLKTLEQNEWFDYLFRHYSPINSGGHGYFITIQRLFLLASLKQDLYQLRVSERVKDTKKWELSEWNTLYSLWRQARFLSGYSNSYVATLLAITIDTLEQTMRLQYLLLDTYPQYSLEKTSWDGKSMGANQFIQLWEAARRNLSWLKSMKRNKV